MIPGFSTKKIKCQIRLGECLKLARHKKEISFADAETGSKVRMKYLAALEEGKWDVLPQAVYTRGFVLAYARFLELDIELVAKLFEQEVRLHRKAEDQRIAYGQTVSEAKVLVTPRFLAYSTLSLLVVSVVTYIIYQVAGFAGSPNLKIVSPSNNAIVDQDEMNLEGITDGNTLITVNDEDVPVTNDGRFSQSLKLHRGVNILSVKAVNRAQKESTEVYTVEYRPKTASVDEAKTDRNF